MILNLILLFKQTSSFINPVHYFSEQSSQTAMPHIPRAGGGIHKQNYSTKVTWALCVLLTTVVLLKKNFKGSANSALSCDGICAVVEKPHKH